MSNGFIFSAKSYSPLHAGAGQATGKVDLPIEREKHTEFPCVYATGLKGSLRSFCENNGGSIIPKDKVSLIFGEEDSNSAAGGAIFTELKLLLFPVRSSEGSFKYVTSSFVIERFKRDYKLATGNNEKEFNFGSPATMVEMIDGVTPGAHILLEDFVFEKNTNHGILEPFGIKLNDIYVVSEEIFKFFVTNATQIIARNKIKNETQTSENLWYEEVLPADSVLYSFVLPSVANQTELSTLKNFVSNKIIQIGGGETVGYGIVEIKNL